MENVKKNIMGTISFSHKFQGMRKAQEFIVYPKHECNDSKLMIQSDTRIGILDAVTGKVTLSKPHSSGAYGHHLVIDKLTACQIDDADLLTLRNAVIASGDNIVGQSFVKTCNIGALTI
jgi:hypothetical protein